MKKIGSNFHRILNKEIIKFLNEAKNPPGIDLKEKYKDYLDDPIYAAYVGASASSNRVLPTTDTSSEDSDESDNDPSVGQEYGGDREEDLSGYAEESVDDKINDPVVNTTDARRKEGEPNDEKVDQETNPEDESDKEKVKKSLMEKFNDSKVVDFGLDILGTVSGYVADAAVAGSMGLGAPVAYTLAAVPDLLNSIRHAARGERGEAAIYFLCALPIIGEVLGPVKIAMKVLGTAARAREVYAVIKNIRKLTKAAGVSKLPVDTAKKIKEVCDDHFPSYDANKTFQDANILMNGNKSEVAEIFKVSSQEDTNADNKDASADTVTTSTSTVKAPSTKDDWDGSKQWENKKNDRHSLSFLLEGWEQDTSAGSRAQESKKDLKFIDIIYDSSRVSPHTRKYDRR